ncbi:hypothetical protein QS257_04535 [Terrilactibacillus sp. S3-3]|jgi:hypothetical protein|nr:hypothetical protein QS257_04535 [Terrilactibacillus sp. S3-3]
MSILSELNTLVSAIPLPVETGVFSGKAPDEYVVILPLSDIFEVHADNRPGFEVQEARISLFSKGNYLLCKKQIVTALLNADFTVTEHRYIGHEDDTGYHHYAIDVAKNYGLEE